MPKTDGQSTEPFGFTQDGAANEDEMKVIQKVLLDAAQAKQPEEPEEPTEPVYVVSEWEVRNLLQYGFQAGHFFTGHEHWIATDAELDSVVPGVTRLINRSSFLANSVGRVAEYSDWASLGKLFWMLIRRYLSSLKIWAEEKKAKEAEILGNGQLAAEPKYHNS